ncbi:PP2C family serine/threonine-protein phosphatase [Egicoccus sp. AB-alg2]|uniref:PP2C family protein-serine/threonine phosphatase n=1 Tax=Egicoccus sp. AB-alg2 TaxID=3242693 RepID=UPI00359CEF08
MHLDVWVVTHASLTHTENEDRAVVADTVLAEAASVEHHQLSAPTMLAALDGLGGHSAGNVASHLAAKLLAASDVPRDEPAAEALLQLADQTLHDATATDPALTGMGATVAMLAVLDGHLVTANVGDTTAWRYSDAQLEPLTVSDRIGGSQIGQCLGATGDLAPHVRTVDLTAGDRLLLASDGLTDVVDADTIAQALRGPADQAVSQLYGMVEAARFPDDVTIVLAEVQAADVS